MKHKLLNILYFILYWLGVDAFFYFLNRKAKRIITFHNVLPEELLPQGKKIGIIDTIDEFRRKLRILLKRYEVSNDIFDCKTATITFDDGYKNQATVAFNILKEEGSIPAIIFASGKNLNNSDPNQSLVIDLLLHWTYLVPDGTYCVNLKKNVKRFTTTEKNRRQIWQTIIWPLFCIDNDTKGESLLNELNKQCPMSKILARCSTEYVDLRLTGITQNDIEKIEKKWIVGWHTQSHYPLSKLSIAEKEKELCGNPEWMSNIVMSYPYGELSSVDRECIKIAECAGFPSALSNINEPNELTGRYFIPRMTLYGNFYQINFELSGIKYFVKHCKLLPIIK